MKSFNLGTSAIVAALMSSTAMAQSSTQDQGAAAATTAKQPVAIGDIIVTAQRRSEKLRDVPISIIAQTREDLDRAGVVGTKDLAALVPGLTFGGQGALAQPGIRGVQSLGGSAGTDTPIAIYVDGFYQPNQVGNFLDLPDVAQVEVLKGPQGTLFGRNATGGAITIRTLAPSLTEVTGSVTLSDGAFFGNNVKTSNDFSAKGFVSVPIVDDVLAISASGYYNKIAGYMTNDVTGGRYGKVESYLGRIKILFKPTEDLRFTLSGMISRRQDEASSTLFPLNGVTVAQQYPGAIIPTKPWHEAGENNGGSFSDSRHRDVTLTAEWHIEGAGDMTSRTGYAYTNSPLTTDVDASYAPNCLAVVACINYGYGYGPNRTFQQEVTFGSDKFGIFSFVAGAFYYKDKMDQTQSINPPIRPGQPINLDDPSMIFYNIKKVVTKAYAGFGEVYLDPADSLRIIAGIRYSHETKDAALLAGMGPPTIPGGAWSAWTPRLSVLYRISPVVNLYSTYSKGFKSGTPNLDTGTAPANPENLTAYEAGFKIGTRSFSLNAAAFYYDYSNLQVQFFNGISTTNTNAAKAKIYGFDFDGSVQVTSSLQLRAAASWVPHAQYVSYPSAVDYNFPQGPYGLTSVVIDASGQRILKAPKLTGSVTARYEKELTLGKLDASVTVYHSSSMRWHFLDRVKTENYFTLSGQIGVTLPNAPIRLSLWGKNLTNKAYITGAILGAVADGVSFSQPREVGMSAEFKF